jgi:single-stranded-DNA-specific exonuclease
MPHWRLIPTDEEAVTRLQSSLHLPALFCRLLVQRGVYSLSAAQCFFRPNLDDHLHNPYEMRDMDIAVARLDAALRQGERILLYGDYDVDGTTSVALMYAFLSGFYRNLDYYLPDRDKEGYGVSEEGIEYARQTGCSLLIAMDCGIKAHRAIELAKSYGIDVIVCDHHVPEGDLPLAVANLDPKRPDCPYPYKELSGCGIAFKLAQALAMHNNTPIQELEHLLDFVAISIACDIVPMDGENRILTYFGLRQLNASPRTGIMALKKRIRREGALEINDLVFGLGPLINAAGRLGDARDAVRLLLSADRNAAFEQAGALVHRNQQRREVDQSTTERARQQVMNTPGWENRKSIVVFDPSWHKGIIGIAASRIAEHFHRPAVVLMQSGDKAVGSARSVPGFDLYAALNACEDLFFSFGGHAHAAGMQMDPENVPLFMERFEQAVRDHMTPEAEAPILEYCAELRLEDLTPAFFKMLRRFEPYGPANRNPVFRLSGLVDSGESRLLDNNHVRLSVKHPESPLVWKGIGFGLGQTFESVKDGAFDVLFNLREDEWKGEKTLSLQVKDLRKH